MAQLTSWLASAVAAAIPTGAIIWQMVQQGEGLRQQIVAIQNQNEMMQEQIRLEEQRIDAVAQARLETQRLQAITFVAQHIGVIDSGSPTAQRQLARLLTQSFPPDVACPFVQDWIATSTSLEHWQALRSGAGACTDAVTTAAPDPAAPAVPAEATAEPEAAAEATAEPEAAAEEAVAPATGVAEGEGDCGLVFLHHMDSADQEKARGVAALLRQAGCEVRGPTLAPGRVPGVYGPAGAAQARADQLRGALRRYQEVFVREEDVAALEIILPNL